MKKNKLKKKLWMDCSKFRERMITQRTKPEDNLLLL